MSESPQIDIRVQTIAADLLAGQHRDAIVSTRGKEWQCSARTIDRYIAKAKKIAESTLDAAAKKIQDQTSTVVADAVVDGLRSSLDVDLRVQEIIFGSHKLIRIPDQLDASGKVVVKGRVVGIDNRSTDVLKAATLYYRRNNLLGAKADLTKKKVKIVITGKPRPEQQTDNP